MTTSITPFPQILSKILKDESHSDIISWLPHGKGFILQDKKRFADEVMPRYFKDAKFTSFTRRLNRWCFIHRPKGNCESQYFHPLFVQGDRKKLFEMSPKPQVCYKKKKKKKTAQLSVPEMQPQQNLLQAEKNLISSFTGLVQPGLDAMSASQRLLDRWKNSPTAGLSQPSFPSMPSLNHQTQFNYDEGSKFKGLVEDKYSLPKDDRNHFAMTRSSSAPLDLERTLSSAALNSTAAPNGNYSEQISTSLSALHGMNNLGSIHDLIASMYSQQIYNANQQTAPFMSSNHDMMRLMMLQQTRQQVVNSLLMSGGGMNAQSSSTNANLWSQAMMLSSSGHHNQGIDLASKTEESLKFHQPSANKGFGSPQLSNCAYQQTSSQIDNSLNSNAIHNARVSTSPANAETLPCPRS